MNLPVCLCISVCVFVCERGCRCVRVFIMLCRRVFDVCVWVCVRVRQLCVNRDERRKVNAWPCIIHEADLAEGSQGSPHHCRGSRHKQPRVWGRKDSACVYVCVDVCKWKRREKQAKQKETQNMKNKPPEDRRVSSFTTLVPDSVSI